MKANDPQVVTGGAKDETDLVRTQSDCCPESA